MRGKGFTLIEMLIVLAIIIILAGAMIPMIRFSRAQARRAKVDTDLDTIATAAMLFYHDCNQNPPTGTTGAGLTNQSGACTAALGWEGPYLAEWRIGPYPSPGNVTYELYNTTLTDLRVSSWGPDGADNAGAGDDIVRIIRAP